MSQNRQISAISQKVNSLANEREYKLYTAQINILDETSRHKLYPVNHAAFISDGDFVTPTEIKNTSISESLSKSINKTILDINWVDNTIDENKLSINAIQSIISLLESAENNFQILINRQNEYINDYDAIMHSNLNSSVDRDFQFKLLQMTDTYFPDFENIERILLIVHIAKNACIQALKNDIDYTQLNQVIAALDERLKDYVIKHPYKSASHSIVHGLLNQLIFKSQLLENEIKLYHQYNNKVEEITNKNTSIFTGCNLYTQESIEKFINAIDLIVNHNDDLKHLLPLDKIKIKHDIITALTNVNWNKIYLNRANKNNEYISPSEIMKAVLNTNPELNFEDWMTPINQHFNQVHSEFNKKDHQKIKPDYSLSANKVSNTKTFFQFFQSAKESTPTSAVAQDKHKKIVNKP